MKEKIYPREKYLSKIRPFYDSDIVKVITGIRRSGKSSILKSIISEIKNKGLSEEWAEALLCCKKTIIHKNIEQKLLQ